MKQHKSATELIASLRASTVPHELRRGTTYALWAPGDATLYRVSLVTWWPVERESELPTYHMLQVMMDRDIISLAQPAGNYFWTPERFANWVGDRRAGWWGGVRPLLAALEWVPEGLRNTEFSHFDAVEIDRYLNA